MLSFVKYSILCILVFAPLAIGSVHTVTCSLISATIFLSLIVHIWKLNLGYFSAGYLRKTKVLLLIYALFISFLLFQTLPIPTSLLRSLSPKTFSIYQDLDLVSEKNLLPLSLSTDLTIRNLLLWLSYGGIFFVVSTFRVRAERFNFLELVSITIVFTGLVEAVYGMYNYLNEPEKLLWFKRASVLDSVSGTFVNRNHFAAYLNLCLFLSFGSLLYHLERKRKDPLYSATFVYAFAISSLLMLLSLIFSKSRMGQLSFVFGIVVFLALYGTRRYPLRVAFILFVVLAALFWAYTRGLGPVIERWMALDRDFPARAIIWQETEKMIRSFSLFGCGLGSYVQVFPLFKPESLGAQIFHHAHNDYLQLLAELGFLGFGLLSAFFLCFFLFVIPSWIRAKRPFSKHIGLSGIVASLTLLLHSVAEFNLHIPAISLTLFAVMGLTWRLLSDESQKEDKP